jgi:CheY-like chemotaxis protein
MKNSSDCTVGVTITRDMMLHRLPKNTTLAQRTQVLGLENPDCRRRFHIWIPYRIALEKRGHVVDLAQNGEECCEFYKTALKDAIRQKKSDEDKYYYHHTDSSSSSRSTSASSNDQALSSSPSSSLLLPAKAPFDAVVLDYRMPKKDGLEVAKEILASNPSQRIIFASAYVKETLRESVKELRQVVELMQKPFLPEALVDVLEDSQAYPELKKLFGNVKKMSEIDFENPTPDQIRDIFEGLKKIQKGRTF